MSAPASPTGVPPTPLDTVPLPHLLPEAGPSTSSDSGASCAEKDHVKHDEQLDGQDEHEHEQAEIDAAEEEIHQERQREVEEGGKAKGVSGWVARRLFKRRPARASGDQATPADGGGNDSLAVQPETRLLPIISGLACPFAVLLDIPGLTTPWYVKTQGDTIVDSKPNPVLLDVGQALCLALGVLANGALIFRFLEHRPRLTTWLAMICLTVGRLVARTARRHTQLTTRPVRKDSRRHRHRERHVVRRRAPLQRRIHVLGRLLALRCSGRRQPCLQFYSRIRPHPHQGL